jgi:hypothetical protein
MGDRKKACPLVVIEKTGAAGRLALTCGDTLAGPASSREALLGAVEAAAMIGVGMAVASPGGAVRGCRAALRLSVLRYGITSHRWDLLYPCISLPPHMFPPARRTASMHRNIRRAIEAFLIGFDAGKNWLTRSRALDHECTHADTPQITPLGPQSPFGTQLIKPPWVPKWRGDRRGVKNATNSDKEPGKR